ncbi:MAG: hypothetical protein WC615_06575 [Mucilaginibacter sp.]|uniref:hypothetical protein n=1 Tax=Mucilaginibacter sp. TaxID=1882438 RepID=UPI0035633AA2
MMRNLGLMFLLTVILTNRNAYAQTKADIRYAKRLFEGNWINKKAKRHLSISFDYNDYVLINDWHGKFSSDNNTIDAYKAFIEKEKLVMPEEKEDLHAPYCEILRKGNALLYRCKGMGPTAKVFIDEIWFVREKE